MTLTGSASDQLRSRASNLRALARRLNALRVLDCYRSAGSETWVGPSPQRCDDMLRRIPVTLRAEADSLSIEARRIDRLADEAEARARLTRLS
jgi:hypothetical protein